MTTPQSHTVSTLEDLRLPLQVKLAAAWTGVMFFYIYVSVFNVVGESWVFFYGLGVVIEVLLLAFILRAAWTWPRRATSPPRS